MDCNRLLLIGKIIGAHGIRGAVKVFSYAESMSRYAAGSTLHMRDAGGAESKVRISWAKPHSKVILISFEGITDRDRAEALSGAELFIDRDLLEETQEGTFYWSDLIGMTVLDMQGGVLGKLSSIIETGSNDVYVVKRQEPGQTGETLIPALEWVVREVDLEKKIMRVDLPEGL